MAFISDRGGKRGIWIVPSAGGTPRLVAEGAVLDRVTWSSESTRVIYALGGGAKATLWMVAANGGAPIQIPGASGRAPAASPIGDVIAVARSDNDRPALHFLTSSGTESRKPLSIEALGLPTAIAWSPDANRIALINLPGRAAAEVWVLTLADGTARKLVEFGAPAELDGITWTADGRALIVGRIDYETEVLLASRTARRAALTVRVATLRIEAVNAAGRSVYLLAGRTAEDERPEHQPSDLPLAIEDRALDDRLLLEGEDEFDGLPVFHLPLTPIGDALESAKLGDEPWPCRLQFGFRQVLREPGVEVLHDVRGLAVLQVLEDGLGLRNRGVPGQLREKRDCETNDQRDDHGRNDSSSWLITPLPSSLTSGCLS